MMLTRLLSSRSCGRAASLGTWLAGGCAVAGLLTGLSACTAQADSNGSAIPAAAAMTVSVVSPRSEPLPQRVVAEGSISAWQEAVIGTDAQGLRVAEVLVNVGETVRQGQVLATFADDAARAEFAQARAAVSEAEAMASQAAANARRARSVQSTGALSESAIDQFLTAEQTAQAHAAAQRAGMRVQELRLQHTRVVAPDRGIISSRTATVGAVVASGQELFRLIRQGRLEWRAEVAASDLASIQPGMKATLTFSASPSLQGTVRTVGPSVDPQTRTGIVYVDLPAPGSARMGMYARGDIDTGTAPATALTLPQSAVQQRSSFGYVMRVDADSRVSLTKVGLGRRLGDRIEVTGIDAKASVVATGAALLTDGDTVRVIAPLAASDPGDLAAPAVVNPADMTAAASAAAADPPPMARPTKRTQAARAADALAPTGQVQALERAQDELLAAVHRQLDEMADAAGAAGQTVAARAQADRRRRLQSMLDAIERRIARQNAAASLASLPYPSSKGRINTVSSRRLAKAAVAERPAP